VSINFIFSCLQLRNSSFFFSGTSHSLGTTVLEVDADFGKVPINLAHNDLGLREYRAELYQPHLVYDVIQVHGIYCSLSV
jgi:hypothetical protein